MNEHSDMDRVLRHWFDDGPSTMPDRVVDVVADRIGRQRQRPAWRLLWRPFDMNSTLKIGAAIAAVLVIAVIGWNLLPGRSPGVGSLEPTPTPIPSSTAAATPTSPPTRPPWVEPGRTCGDGPGPYGCAGELAAGTHQSLGLVPLMRFTVPGGWLNTGDFTAWFVLTPDTPANRAKMEQQVAPEQQIIVLPDSAILESRCEDVAGAEPRPSAAQLVAAIEAADGIDTTVPTPITVGALSGQSVDVRLSAGWTGTCPDFPTAPSVHVIGNQVVEGARYRFIALDAPGGRNILIMLRARDQATFDSLTAAGMPIVESFEFDFGPGASATPS